MAKNSNRERFEKVPNLGQGFLPHLRPQGDIVRQRVCSNCGGRNFEVYKGRRPKKGILGYYTKCLGCEKALWMMANLTG